MSWIVGSRQDHGSGTGLKSRALFHPCTGVTAEKRPAGRRRQGPRHGPPAPVRGAGGRGPVHPGRSHRGGRRLAPGYPFDGTIGGAKLVGRMVDAATYRPGFGLSQVVLGTVVGDIGFHAAPDEGGSVEIGYGAGASPPRRPGRWSSGRCASPCDRGARGDGQRAGRPLPDRRAAPGRGSCSSIARSPEQHRDLCPAAPRDEGQQDTEDDRGDQVPEITDRRRSR